MENVEEGLLFKKKGTLKIVIGVALVTALAVGLPLMAGCTKAPAEVTPPPGEEVTPPPGEEVTPPPEANVITAKIGMNIPMTGPVAGWGLPGFYGNEIWAEQINAAGGFEMLDGTRVMVELVPYDNEYTNEKALAGAKKLTLEDEVVIIQTMMGAPVVACQPFYTEHQMISTTLAPDDCSPSALYHVAPVEITPFHDILIMEWMANNYPELKTMAISEADDPNGRAAHSGFVSAATAGGIETIYDDFYDYDTTDFAPVISAMKASGADIFNLGASYPDFVNLMLQQAYEQGWDAPKISCTLDFYDAIIEKTSVEFMEDIIWCFPDFDDELLNPSPNPYATMQPLAFYDEFNSRYPGTWSAVSWEYCDILDVWKQGAINSSSIEPMDVFASWKSAPTMYNTFGEAEWWGKPMWGIDNALMGNWPVVQMKSGKATIVGFGNVLDWWEDNEEVAIETFTHYNNMWYQKMGISRAEAMELYPEAFE